VTVRNSYKIETVGVLIPSALGLYKIFFHLFLCVQESIILYHPRPFA